jgi:hypothetical protein
MNKIYKDKFHIDFCKFPNLFENLGAILQKFKTFFRFCNYCKTEKECKEHQMESKYKFLCGKCFNMQKDKFISCKICNKNSINWIKHFNYNEDLTYTCSDCLKIEERVKKMSEKLGKNSYFS